MQKVFKIMVLAFMLVGSFVFANESFVLDETTGTQIEMINENIDLTSNIEISEDILGPCSYWVHVYDNGRYVGSTIVWDWHFGCNGMHTVHMNFVPILA